LTFGGKVKGLGQFFFWRETDFFQVKLPEKTIYAKIISALVAVFDLRGVKDQGRFFSWLEMDFFHVKLPEKTIYAKIITAREAVFDPLGIKGQGQFFFDNCGLYMCHNLQELFDMRISKQRKSFLCTYTRMTKISRINKKI